MDIRVLDPADLDAALDVRSRSFGPLPGGAEPHWRAMVERSVRDRRALAGYAGATPVAMARINEQVQWWGGRSLPLAGIGGVVVAPEHRGRGAGTSLMTEVLRHARVEGYVLSALYPATVPVYRALGYEFGGAQHKISLDPAAVRSLGRGVMDGIRRATPDDATLVRSTIEAHHAASRDCGPIGWSLADCVDELADTDDYYHLADDGLLAYGWSGSGKLTVTTLVAGSEQTLRAFWAIVGSGSSVVDEVIACAAPHDPIRWLLRDKGLTTKADEWWMLRLLDVDRALTGRGYPAPVTADVTMTVTDPQLPDNDGGRRLVVADGLATVEPVDPPPGSLALGPNGLAALYAGTPLAVLRLAGLVTGGTPADDRALDAAFAARPYMLDYF